MKSKSLSPRDANTFDQVCSLKTDHKDLREFWMSVDGDVVTIAKQRMGSDATEIITIPKRQFHALLDWYFKEQPLS